jgi:hypothetical protein
MWNGAGYITVDPEKRRSEIGIWFSQQMCHIMFLFHSGSTIKDERNTKCHVFVQVGEVYTV